MSNGRTLQKRDRNETHSNMSAGHSRSPAEAFGRRRETKKATIKEGFPERL